MINKYQIPKKKSVSERGFTLIELMVVIIIVAVVAGLTLGGINSSGYQLKSRAHTLKAHMMQAKLEAVKRDLNVTIAINGTNDGYVVTDSAATIITVINYMNKFTFTGNNTVFTPKGTANSNSITIVGKGTTNSEYTISINNIGRVRLEKTKN